MPWSSPLPQLGSVHDTQGLLIAATVASLERDIPLSAWRFQTITFVKMYNRDSSVA